MRTYIKFPCELHNKITKTNFTQNETKILNTIIKKTYGWHKEENYITYEYFCEYTNLTKTEMLSYLRKSEMLFAVPWLFGT